MPTLEDRLRTRIGAAGKITFAEFMEMALYYGELGYYTKPDRISARGDFYTSPEVHPAFGSLICVQLQEMWEHLDRPREFSCIEMGAARGRLANDITRYAARLDRAFAASLRYETVDRAAPGQPRHPPAAGATGVLLSNELLDALPVHRFVVHRGEIRELYVCINGDGKFSLEPGDPSMGVKSERLAGIAARLPDGFSGEVSAGLADWAKQADRAIARGYVITIDFGHDRTALYDSSRSAGTLRSYWRHELVGSPFERIGNQDMAAHVDFTAVDEELAAAGFAKLGQATQSDFLVRLGARGWVRRVRDSGASLADQQRARAGLLELIKPEGLGGFRVLIHGRGIDPERRLSGLSDVSRASTLELPFPLAEPDDLRLPLVDARYPHALPEPDFTWEDLLGPGGRD